MILIAFLTLLQIATVAARMMDNDLTISENTLSPSKKPVSVPAVNRRADPSLQGSRHSGNAGALLACTGNRHMERAGRVIWIFWFAVASLLTAWVPGLKPQRPGIPVVIGAWDLKLATLDHSLGLAEPEKKYPTFGVARRAHPPKLTLWRESSPLTASPKLAKRSEGFDFL